MEGRFILEKSPKISGGVSNIYGYENSKKKHLDIGWVCFANENNTSHHLLVFTDVLIYFATTCY